MSRYTLGQIEQIWVNNGGNAGWAPLMAAIAIAESGGTSSALNNTPSTGDYSVGLWQINYYNGLLASRTASYGSPSALQATVNKQAQAAVHLFGTGAGISNWKGDPAYRAWTAAGRPQKPAEVTVIKWLGNLGLYGKATGAGTTQVPTTKTAGVHTATATTPGTACIIKFPGVGGVGSFCVLNKSQGRALLGGLLVVGGGLGMAFGLALLAAYGLEGTVASQFGKQLAKSLPGGKQVTKEAPKPDADDQQFLDLPPAEKGRITRENKQTSAPFTEADQTLPSRPGQPARPRSTPRPPAPRRERRPRAATKR